MQSASDSTSFLFQNCPPEQARRILQNALRPEEYGELFLEYRQSEVLSLSDGVIKTASFKTDQGFGLRVLRGEKIGYAHNTDITETAFKRSIDALQAVTSGKSATVSSPQTASTSPLAPLYSEDNPIVAYPLESKVATLLELDAYARQKDAHVQQVMATLNSSWQTVGIVRPDTLVTDVRPLQVLMVQVVLATPDGRFEMGQYGCGGRDVPSDWLTRPHWQSVVDEALRIAQLNVEARPAPAGEFPVVLGKGWPGILLHEAVGHGLEGDFNRKKTSNFSNLMGKQVAAKGVTVLDDGTLPGRRGSLTVDDEGTPTQRTTLIEDGILVGYMQDRQNAHLMGHTPTGNGRRQSYAHPPMPRMTNTFMLAGKDDPDEILEGVSDGIYAVNFKGGQVDITSGQFVFELDEAYRVEKGKITHPIRGAMLIGDGPTAMKQISKIGTDLKLDPGIGTCGKDSQTVPVGVGQPTLLIDRLTVGGTG